VQPPGLATAVDRGRLRQGPGHTVRAFRGAAGLARSVCRAQTVLTFFVLGAGIGLVAGVSPGPVLTLVVAETLKGGWLRGAAVAAGPLLADGPIIVLAVTVMNQLPSTFEPAISLVGSVFLLYLAVTAAINARQAKLPS